MHSKFNGSRKVKTSYNLKQREYLFKVGPNPIKNPIKITNSLLLISVLCNKLYISLKIKLNDMDMDTIACR
jgi:hypothetical protein